LNSSTAEYAPWNLQNVSRSGDDIAGGTKSMMRPSRMISGVR
jgi:hypothetical protein